MKSTATQPTCYAIFKLFLKPLGSFLIIKEGLSGTAGHHIQQTNQLLWQARGNLTLAVPLHSSPAQQQPLTPSEQAKAAGPSGGWDYPRQARGGRPDGYYGGLFTRTLSPIKSAGRSGHPYLPELLRVPGCCPSAEPRLEEAARTGTPQRAPAARGASPCG